MQLVFELISLAKSFKVNDYFLKQCVQINISAHFDQYRQENTWESLQKDSEIDFKEKVESFSPDYLPSVILNN